MTHLVQAGAVPFRVVGAHPEFLLVTSHQGRWIFPKGNVEPGETPEATAKKEVEEEAGVSGTVLPSPIASYDDRKSWTRFQVLMYLLEYTGDCDRWREAGHRARRWCRYEEARDLLEKGHLLDVLAAARERAERSKGSGASAVST